MMCPGVMDKKKTGADRHRETVTGKIMNDIHTQKKKK